MLSWAAVFQELPSVQVRSLHFSTVCLYLVSVTLSPHSSGHCMSGIKIPGYFLRGQYGKVHELTASGGSTLCSDLLATKERTVRLVRLVLLKSRVEVNLLLISESAVD